MKQPKRSPHFASPTVRLAIGLGLTVALFFRGQASAMTPVSAVIAASLTGQNEYGTIKGRLVWGGDAAPAPDVLQPVGKAAKDPNVCAKSVQILSRELVVDAKTKGVAFGFAYLSSPKGKNPAALKELLEKQPKVELDQKNCEFEPYALPMNQGQMLVIKASDPLINHNVRISAFNNPGLNQTLAPQGKLQLNLVAERRPIKMACDIHPWMHSYVMVFDHPFFATTAADGSFEIKGVPAGTQNLILWQETIGYVTPGGGRGMSVEVKAGKVTDVGEITVDPKKVRKS